MAGRFSGIAVQFECAIKMTLDHADTLGELFGNDVEKETGLRIGVSERPCPVRLDEALVKDFLDRKSVV